MYAAKPPPVTKLVEASESITKAKAYLGVLQRQKRIPAVVDFVASGSRFKVIIPRENVRLTLVLGGIRAPRTARNASEQSEPFGQEALDYSTKRCMQRDVEIDIDDIDRIGGFIGTLYVNRESIAKGLLEEGFATVHAYSAEKSGHGNELFAAEMKAKQARKGMWHDWTPEKDEGGENHTDLAGGAAKEEPIERKKDYRDVIVTNVDDQGRMKVQLIGTGEHFGGSQGVKTSLTFICRYCRSRGTDDCF
jgi:staphylococcal nuclease domain-containing protein 1